MKMYKVERSVGVSEISDRIFIWIAPAAMIFLFYQIILLSGIKGKLLNR